MVPDDDPPAKDPCKRKYSCGDNDKPKRHDRKHRDYGSKDNGHSWKGKDFGWKGKDYSKRD